MKLISDGRKRHDVTSDGVDNIALGNGMTEMHEDQTKLTTVSQEFLRRTVRWKTRRDNASSGGANSIESRTMRLVKTVQQKDVDGLKKQLQELKQQAVAVSALNVHDEYAVSLLEHAVRTGSIDVVNTLIGSCHTAEERSHAIQRTILFAVKRNDIDICRHAVQLSKANGEYIDASDENGKDGWLASYPEGDKADRMSQGDGHGKHNDGQRLAGVVALRMHIGRKWNKKWTLNTTYQMDESEFSEEMAPIVMAAQLEHSEIIRLLIDECCYQIHPLTKIPPNHDKSGCYICQEQTNFAGQQTVEACRKAIEVYKALASPAFMFQAGVEDPILEAFRISDIMEQQKVIGPAFVEEYDLIAQQCKKLAVDLLGLCHTSDEVTTLLNHAEGIEKTHQKEHTAKFPRLAVAIYYNQKEFVTHRYCQQVIQNIWYDGLPNWVCRQDGHIFRLFIYSFLLTFAMPFIFIMYMFRLPCVERFVRRPVTKFIFDLLSFMTFLSLLFMNASQKETHIPGSFPRPIEILIMLWLLGYTLRLGRMMKRRNNSSGMAHAAICQGACIMFFWVFFLLRLVLYLTDNIEQDGTLANRLTWKWYNIFLWCEVSYSLACALSVVHLYSFFKASSTLGPLQISLRSMLFDVFRFLTLFVVIISAFAIALNTLYIGYPWLVQRSGDSAHFSSLLDTYKTLFWSLFGYGDPEMADIFVKDVYEMMNRTNVEIIDIKHHLTETVGLCLYGLYHMIVIVVLLNMLVAMMANTYNVVAKNAIMEWRLAWTQLILVYMNELGVTVPPFNILPIRMVIGMITRTGCCKNMDADTGLPGTSYQVVMDRISKRYWRQREEAQNHKTQ